MSRRFAAVLQQKYLCAGEFGNVDESFTLKHAITIATKRFGLNQKQVQTLSSKHFVKLDSTKEINHNHYCCILGVATSEETVIKVH